MCAVPNEGKSRDAGGSLTAHLTDKGITATDIAKMLGVSRATVYRYLSWRAGLRVIVGVPTPSTIKRIDEQPQTAFPPG